jgi:peptidoglycan/LPS O-acetylase OafA/YrhL
MDVLLWGVRATLITVGIILAIFLWKARKDGRFQARYYINFLVIGIAAFIFGLILLIVASTTDLSSFYGSYLTCIGAILIIISVRINNIRKPH